MIQELVYVCVIISSMELDRKVEDFCYEKGLFIKKKNQITIPQNQSM
jgi:hypothetical protein